MKLRTIKARAGQLPHARRPLSATASTVLAWAEKVRAEQALFEQFLRDKLRQIADTLGVPPGMLSAGPRAQLPLWIDPTRYAPILAQAARVHAYDAAETEARETLLALTETTKRLKGSLGFPLFDED